MVVVEFVCIKAFSGASVVGRRVDFGAKEEVGLPGKPVFREDEIRPLLRAGFRLLCSWRELGRRGAGYKFWDLWGSIHVFGDLDRVYRDRNEVEARFREWEAEMNEARAQDEIYLAALEEGAGLDIRQGGNVAH